MLGCMLWELISLPASKHTFPPNFTVFWVKLPCSVALHFVLYPEVAKGMNMMKFANNQCHLFVPNGAVISYFLGFIQASTALLTEGINVYLLTYQHSVEHCIIHFVALEVIMEVSNLYYEALLGNKLKSVLHHIKPKNEKRG